MMLDAQVTFVSQAGAAFSLVASAGTQAVGQVIDELGQGVGTAPANIIGNTSLFGSDMGLGVWKPEIQINIGTALTIASSGTLEFAIQGAPDTGSSGSYQPGTWESFATTGPKPASELAASAVLRMAMPPAPPATLRPRYYRLVAISSQNVTAGTCSSAFIVQGRDDLQSLQQAASNYVVN